MANPVFEVERPKRHGQVLLYGDLSLMQFEDQLRRSLHVKTNPLLISLEQQDLFPRFNTLIDLLAKFSEADGTPVLGFFLLSVHEVAQSIV